MRLFWFIFIGLCWSAHSRTGADIPVRITEFAAAGQQGLRDEDGETPDWIELQNQSAEPVDLAGWVLSEHSRRPKLWTLPNTNLAPAECLVVFASGKDRRIPGKPLHTTFKLASEGGELQLRSPTGEVSRVEAYPPQVPGVSFGLPGQAVDSENKIWLIGSDSALRYHLPTDGSLGARWIAPAFDDSRWKRGTNGIGYDNRGDHYRELLRSDLRQVMAGRVAGLYLRFPFVLTNQAAVATLSLHAQYDDGFVAWLNGTEVARRNVPAASRWDSVAVAAHPDDKARVPEQIALNLGARLVIGTNWLAVHVLNASLESSDLLFRAALGLSAPAEPADPVPAPVYSYLVAPTPGQPNAASAAPGPRIAALTRQPSAPATTKEPILVTARITPVHSPIANVRLCYRVMFGSEIDLEMHDDGQAPDLNAGDQVYSATIPAGTAKPGQMLRYYVLATDEAGQPSRWPLYADRAEYSAYEGAVIPDPSIHTRLPVIHLFSGKDQRPGSRRSPSSVVLFYQGELYDNVIMTPHGQISRGFPKQSYNLRFPRDHYLRCGTNQPRVKGINLMANYADKSKLRNTLAYEMIAASGSIGHFAFPVRVQRNGKFFSVAEVIENGGQRWLERVGLDPQGALYKMNNNLTGTSGAEKQTRKHEDKRDLATLASALSEERPLAQRAEFAYRHVDIPQCVSYLVAMTLISSDDHGHKNYYLYRDTRRSGEWALLPWDVDLSWGRNWTGQYFNETMFTDNPLDLYRDGRRKPRNRLYSLLFEYPEFRQMYLRRLRTVMDDLLQPPGTPADSLIIERRVRELTDLIDPPDVKPSDADLDQAAWQSWGNPASMRQEVQRILKGHLPGRRQFLFQSSRAKLFGDSIPPSQPKNAAIDIAAAELDVPAAQPFICLSNRNRFAVDLSGWRIAGAGIEHQFRPGTVLPASKSIYVTGNISGFRARPPASAGPPPVFAQGDWRGQLNRGQGPLELVDRTGRRIASKPIL